MLSERAGLEPVSDKIPVGSYWLSLSGAPMCSRFIMINIMRKKCCLLFLGDGVFWPNPLITSVELLI